MHRKLILVVCLIAVAALTASAQAVAGLASIGGQVRDASGAAVPGAAVVVANESKGIKRSLTTTEAGIFAAPALVPSSGYTVTVSKPGFANWELKGIDLLVGQSLDFSVNLQVATTATTVEVTAAAPLVESGKVGVSQVVEKDQIDNLPINGRRADTFVLLTPAVTDDGTFGLVSFRGIAAGNSFLTDGNDTTQSFYNENAGRTRIATQISQDAVQEFQVLSNGFSAEFGRAIGGVINTVTRSGGNQTHGTGYWFYRNQDFSAFDRYQVAIPTPESRHQGGGSLSGAIKKDKLFYFVNSEVVKRDFPALNRIINSVLTDSAGKFNATCSATPAQCEVAKNFITRQMDVLVPRTVSSVMGFAKLDWRPSEKNSYSFSSNVMHWRSPHGIQTQAVLTNGNAIANNAHSTVETRYGKFSWTNIPTNSSVNEFRFGWFKDRLGDPEAGDLWPKETGGLGISVGATVGAASSYPRVLPSEQRFQFVDNFSWTKGAHSAKFGIDTATTQDYQNQLSNSRGSYTYSNFSNFAKDLTGNTAGAKNYQSFSQTFGNPILDFRTSDIAFYAQDVWKVNRKLTLNYGVRYEYSWLPQPKVKNPDYPQTGVIHAPSKNWAPRVGLAYSLNEKTVVRANYGIFYARFHGSMFNVLHLNNGVYQTSVSVQPAFAGSPVFPNILSSTAGIPPSSVSINFAAPDFRSPYTQQGSLAIERELARNLGLTVSYLWNRGVALVTVRDLNIGVPGPVATYTIMDASNNAVGTWSTPTYRLANRVDSRYRGVLMADNGGRSWYDGLAVQLRKRMSKGLTGSLAYTWAHAIDNANQGGASDSIWISSVRSTAPGDFNGDKGSSTLDQRHRLVINFLWEPKFTNSTSLVARHVINGWQLSAITTMASAHPVNATVNVSSALPGMAFNNTLNGYGGSNRVPFWPMSALNVDQQYRVDARASRVIPITERVKVNFSWEAFNAFNTIYNTAVNTLAYTASAGVLRPNTAMGRGTQSQGFPDGTNARRMQLSLRVVF